MLLFGLNILGPNLYEAAHHRLLTIYATLAVKVKEKLKVKVWFTLERAMKAQRWSRGIAVLFL